MAETESPEDVLQDSETLAARKIRKAAKAVKKELKAAVMAERVVKDSKADKMVIKAAKRKSKREGGDGAVESDILDVSPAVEKEEASRKLKKEKKERKAKKAQEKEEEEELPDKILSDPSKEEMSEVDKKEAKKVKKAESLRKKELKKSKLDNNLDIKLDTKTATKLDTNTETKVDTKTKTNMDTKIKMDTKDKAVKESEKEGQKKRKIEESGIEGMGLCQSTLTALKERGISELFPIQTASFEPIMSGRDVIARALTGTGKTLAFSLPIVEILKKNGTKVRGRGPKALIMTPTRELAMQVHKEINQLCTNELDTCCFYGGSSYDKQNDALRNGVDIVVGTPGRLIDHIERGSLRLSHLSFLVMDEADMMLDIGFAEDMEKVLRCVEEQQSNPHQTLLFSATLPEWIKNAIKKYMKSDHVVLDLVKCKKLKTSETVLHYSLPSRWQNRNEILGDLVAVFGKGGLGRTIIFVETKMEANELILNEKLAGLGAQVLHGDISQDQREKVMQGYRDGKFSCLITTNVVARGIDIPAVDLVINAEPPDSVESYIHRSGRTGRAGRSGRCITFFKSTQEYLLENITRRAGVEFIRTTAPQPVQIIAARASQSIQELKQVDVNVFSYFEEATEEILKYFNGNSVLALQAALAMICNTTKLLPSRSLLTANNGFKTILFKTENSIKNVGYIKSLIQRNYPTLSYEDTQGWRMTSDNHGVIVDINEEKLKTLNGTTHISGIEWTDGRGITLHFPTELPELGGISDKYSNTAQKSRGFSSARGMRGGRGGGGRGRGGGSSRGRGR